ncbi:MAG: hypothetical protein JKX84_07440 [Flavobacteriales bacterium]|nr:hypothetical protein [Flavobacteriales bacterium]
MTKNIIALFAIALIFSSCKKCYECSLSSYKYCLEYSLTFNGVTDTDDRCYTDEDERDSAVLSFEFAGATVTTSEGNVTTGNQELCGKGSDTDSFVAIWESAGYNCTKQ